MPKKLLIKKGNVIDPANDIDEMIDLYIVDGKIVEVGRGLNFECEVLDASELLVVPGLIDMHVHLREPGQEDKETIATGEDAAAAGGFTTIVCMPNTSPPLDSEELIKYVIERGNKRVNVFPVGAITKGLEGEQLTDIRSLSKWGAVAFSDDGHPVEDDSLMEGALIITRDINSLIISHCEYKNIVKNGLVNEGRISERFNIPGMPAESEEKMVERDIMLSKMTRAPIHIAHVSTARSVELLREAKQKGIKITCEATPHHTLLSENTLESLDANLKMNPPLRRREDVEEIKKGIFDGTIDAIATDHAPHTIKEKEVFSTAPFGVIGMESAFAVMYFYLCCRGNLPVKSLIEMMSKNPAEILNLQKGTLSVGADADITVIDPKLEWTIDVNNFRSKSRNCPFDGWKVKGKVVKTIVSGKYLVK